MKKSALILLFSIAVFSAYGNPQVPNRNVLVSELSFDTNGKWTLEIQFKGEYFSDVFFFEHFISCKAGTSAIKTLHPASALPGGIYILTSDSLITPLTIDPEGDSISVFPEYYSYPIMDDMVFGKLKDAATRAPRPGESIALLSNSYCIDSSPTLGSANDSTGMCSTISGKIIDTFNFLPQNVWLSGEAISKFKPSSDGSYSTRIFSGNRRIDKLYYFETTAGFSPYYYVKISPADIVVEPDTIVNSDFLITELIDALQQQTNADFQQLRIFPNPVKNRIVSYETTLPVKSATCCLLLTNSEGKIIARYPVSESSGTIHLAESLIPGTYFVTLTTNNRKYGISKIMIPD